MKPLKLLSILPSLLLLMALPASAEVLERVVVKVNGSIVTLSEFETRQVAALQAARVDPSHIEEFLRENNAKILQEAIDDLLLVERALALGIRLRPEYINEVIDNIKKENNLTSDEALQEQLRREGMSLDDLKRNIERSILKRQVLNQELKPKTDVTEADALSYYQSHPADYTRPATVHLREVLVTGPDAKRRAAELAQRARKGESFEDLARAQSEAPSKKNGGDLGFVVVMDMSADLSAATSDLPPRGISEPVPSGNDGFRIFQVVERKAANATPFEEVKEAILQQLTKERFDKEYQAYLEGLRKEAVVDVRVREVPLQVDVPAAPSTLRDKTGDSKAAPLPGAPDSEFSVTPQEKPEQVTPGPPAQPKPEENPPPQR
jgi:parvulin-like peptidyl-prolyl isomerase